MYPSGRGGLDLSVRLEPQQAIRLETASRDVKDSPPSTRSVRTPHWKPPPTDTVLNLPEGWCRGGSAWLPQHSMDWSTRTPQPWELPEELSETSVNRPPGVLDWCTPMTRGSYA